MRACWGHADGAARDGEDTGGTNLGECHADAALVGLLDLWWAHLSMGRGWESAPVMSGACVCTPTLFLSVFTGEHKQWCLPASLMLERVPAILLLFGEYFSFESCFLHLQCSCLLNCGTFLCLKAHKSELMSPVLSLLTAGLPSLLCLCLS